MPPSFYAINAGPVLFTLPAAEQAVHLDAIRAAGIGQVRTDSGWHLAEPRPPVDGVHRYYWGYNDRVVAALARAGLTLYALLDYGTGWGAVIPGDAMSPPRDVGDFAAYAAAFARRYGPGGDFWRERPELPRRPATTFEVWNEPNVIGFWHPAPDAAAYAQMLARGGRRDRAGRPGAARRRRRPGQHRRVAVGGAGLPRRHARGAPRSGGQGRRASGSMTTTSRRRRCSPGSCRCARSSTGCSGATSPWTSRRSAGRRQGRCRRCSSRRP